DVLAFASTDAGGFLTHSWSFRGPGSATDVAVPVLCHAALDSLFLAGDGLGRPFAGARIGMRTLAPHWQAAAMPPPPGGAEIHQPLDIHGDFTPQIAFHHIVTIDHFANLQDFLIGQLGYPALMGNIDLLHDFLSVFGPDPMDILQGNNHALVCGYVYTS